MTREPFALWGACAKCGRYDEHEVKYETTEGWYTVKTAANQLAVQGSGYQEWLSRTCVQCGYHWHEACVDADA